MLLLLSLSVVITLAVLAAAVTVQHLTTPGYSNSCMVLFYATSGTFQIADLVSGWFIITASADFLSTVS